MARPTDAWSSVPAAIRARGQRWTPQRQTIIDVLSRTTGHLTGAELVERCREVNAATVPSTVYRTLDVLEELGLVRHGHDAQGREEYHVQPDSAHGHLYCSACGGAWEISGDESEALSALFGERGFEVDLTHVTVAGRCRACRRRRRRGARQSA